MFLHEYLLFIPLQFFYRAPHFAQLGREFSEKHQRYFLSFFLFDIHISKKKIQIRISAKLGIYNCPSLLENAT